MSATTPRRALAGQSRSLSVLLALLCLPSASPAQVLYGSLTGSVTDATDAGIPNAAIEVTHAGTGVVKRTTTDGRGVYLLNDLQPGAYGIKISAASFGAINQQGVLGNADTTQRVDAQSQLSTASETVLVAASAFTLQTDRWDLN